MSRVLSRLIVVAAALTLPGCTRTQDVLEPSAIAPQDRAVATEDPDAQAATAAAAAPANGAAAASTAALGSAATRAARIQFDPIVGATVATAAPLTERLVAKARENGIRLAGSVDPATTHVLKGYFSTITEGQETTVIYVWDVYDPKGTRLHRINGQVKAPSNGAEGWASVTPQTMQSVADKTVADLKLWLAGGTG